MEIKKTIAALAITASSAFSLVGPGNEVKNYCLDYREDANGVKYAGSCDQTANNKKQNKPLLANDCAEGQVSLRAFGNKGKFDIEIRSCLPPNVIQL